MTAIDCPDPPGCPVPDPAAVNTSKLRSVVLPTGSAWTTSAKNAHWPSLFNPSGLGDARFSPLSAAGTIVPTVYLARTPTVALLETAFHEVDPTGSVTVEPAIDLASWLLAEVAVPSDIRAIDLRDVGLDRLGITRDALVATTSEHFPCTRLWASALHGRKVGGQTTHGLVWESRIAEVAGDTSPVLADVDPTVCVLFGDGLPTEAAMWGAEVRYDDLTSGAGLMHAEEIVTLLGGTMV